MKLLTVKPSRRQRRYGGVIPCHGCITPPESQIMVNLRGRWSDCQLLAEQLKRRSLASPGGDGPVVPFVDAEKSTAEAIADLQRRSELLRRRYGL